MTVQRFMHAIGRSVAGLTVLANASAVRGLARTAHPRRWAIAPTLSALACLAGNAALAQYHPQITASIGRGYGMLALSQSILSGTRRLGTHTADQARPASTTPARIEADLSYTADPRVSDHTRAAMIDMLSSDNPSLRSHLERAYADNAVLKEFEDFMSARGYSGHNVADNMAALLWVSWEIVHGSAASPAQIRGAHQQVRGVFLDTPQVRAMTNAERQDAAERLAYQVMINHAAATDALRNGDAAQLAHVRQTVAAIVRNQAGIDLSRLRLTEDGFRSKS